uniref:Pre-mRNA-splicing factor ISY1 n=1 Tax=Trypanosoma congolense (strain IL3000) TaxID=1068625 RepID=G0URF7_TRYCI|nr:conserved hypothetical protein [Trypanosoma congolense IL3000]
MWMKYNISRSSFRPPKLHAHIESCFFLCYYYCYHLESLCRMQDYLREIEGKLARKTERQDTLLYRLAKRKADEVRLAKLGIRCIPSNPLETTDVNVAKYVIFKLKQEIGDKVARLRNANLLSIETHGEVTVRAKNDEVNHLISKKDLWERRLATLKGECHRGKRPQKIYFGSASYLPEARKKGCGTTDHTSDDGDGYVSSNSQVSSCSEDIPQKPSDLYLGQVTSRSSEESLRSIEAGAEQRLRLKHFYSEENSLKHTREEGTAFIVNIVLPEEINFRRLLVERKKRAFQERINALRG